MIKDGKLVFSPKVAKWLINRGHKIIDLKPLRQDRSKTVFIFEYEIGLEEAIRNYKETKNIQSN